MNDELDKLFKTLIAESKQETKKKAKKKLHTSKRKAIVRKISHNILYIARKIDDRHEKILRGKLERHYIRAEIAIQVCGFCKDERRIVKNMLVISRTREGDSRVTAHIAAKGMYEFHYDLPIKIIEYKEFISICPFCLEAHAKGRILDEAKAS